MRHPEPPAGGVSGCTVSDPRLIQLQAIKKLVLLINLAA
jgi:hypothetical protein